MIIQKFKYKSVNSTNSTAINIIKKKNLKAGFVISETQKKGRGQRGKKWISYRGNLFVSIFFSLEKINLSIKQLTKLNVELIKKLISKYYKKKIDVKVPNDILINKKKICGILQETIQKKKIKYLIVGVGVNLVKNPNISYYPTTNLNYLIKKKITTAQVIKDLNYIYKIFFKSYKVFK